MSAEPKPGVERPVSKQDGAAPVTGKPSAEEQRATAEIVDSLMLTPTRSTRLRPNALQLERAFED